MAFSPLASVRATREVLLAHDLYTTKSLGQHLLIDDNVVGRILELARIDAGDIVLEVGPGIGTLTAALCGRAGGVVAVERDERLRPVLASTLHDCPDVRIIFGDARDVSAADIEQPFGPPSLFVANLPYGVAATLVLRYFQEIGSLRAATIMVQSEVADRMTARPCTKAYGSYSVKLQLIVRPAGRFPVSRGCFMPPPRVDSAVVRLERRVPPLAEPGILELASRLADISFAQRRKTLSNNLRAGLAGGAEAAAELLSSAGINGGLRAEVLDVEQFVDMARKAHELRLLP